MSTVYHCILQALSLQVEAIPSTSIGSPLHYHALLYTLPIRGVCEGFYGRPWSALERQDCFALIKKLGMNTYMHAPKTTLTTVGFGASATPPHAWRRSAN